MVRTVAFLLCLAAGLPALATAPVPVWLPGKGPAAPVTLAVCAEDAAALTESCRKARCALVTVASEADMSAALAAIQEHAVEWNVDPKRIGLVGGCGAVSVALTDGNRYGVRAVAVVRSAVAAGDPLPSDCPESRMPRVYIAQLPVPAAEGTFLSRLSSMCAAKNSPMSEVPAATLHAEFLEYLRLPLTHTLDYGGEKTVVNYDEMAIPPYTLEDPLTFADGRKVKTPAEWEARRRELVDLFAREMYGKAPPPPETLAIKVVDEKVACAGFAIRKRFEMRFRKDGTGPAIDWVVYRPRHAKGPVPVVAFLNYRGNHELTTDPDLEPTKGWCQKGKRTDGHRASVRTRGAMTDPNSDSYLPLNAILARGYAIMSACYCDISPDPINPVWGEKEFPQDTFSYTGVFDLWPKRDPAGMSETTAFGAWAWALSRAVDYAERDPALDARRFVATGCSRLAKAALLAGSRDTRIAVTVPVQTGGGGCPLAKRNFGETPDVLMHSFSHWFCKAYGRYVHEPWRTLPFDQHLLLATIAPRALLVLGFDDRWYDTKGEYLAVKAAAPVWPFLGAGAFPDEPFPPDFAVSCVGAGIGYAHRSENHGISAWDWKTMLDFADAAFRRR